MASKKKARRPTPPPRRPAPAPKRAEAKPIRIPHKDPSIAVLISVLGLLAAAPSIGYFYLHQTRKGIIYLLATWILAAIVIAISIAIGYFTLGLGLICAAPIGLVFLIYEAFIIYDVYLTASHQTPKLPTF